MKIECLAGSHWDRGGAAIGLDQPKYLREESREVLNREQKICSRVGAECVAAGVDKLGLVDEALKKKFSKSSACYQVSRYGVQRLRNMP